MRVLTILYMCVYLHMYYLSRFVRVCDNEKTIQSIIVGKKTEKKTFKNDNKNNHKKTCMKPILGNDGWTSFV